jgi:hypothetical protein
MKLQNEEQPMKCALVFFCCLLPLLSGCLEVDYIRHEMEVTLKDGVPCFSPLSDARVHKEQVEIYSATLGQNIPNDLPKLLWGNVWEDRIILSGDKCIPYAGDFPLEKNTLYGFGFVVHVTGQKQKEEHLYSTVFCLSDGKDGKTIIHQFPEDVPETCPPVAENDGDAP